MSSGVPLGLKKPCRVDVRGNMVIIYSIWEKRNRITSRMIVGGDWVRLWFALQEGGWLKDAWDAMPQKERLWMVRCARSINLTNKQLEIEHAYDQKRDMDRLATLEGEVYAGNMSHRIADEYDDILNQLKYCYDLDSRYAGQLRNRMARSLAKALEAKKEKDV